MRKTKIVSILNILQKTFAERSVTELIYCSHYTLLVAVLLSARATDSSVNRATDELFKIANNPQDMLALGEARLQTYLKGINYFRTKARNVIQLSQVLMDKFDSTVPHTRDALELLPGVGRKTANVVLNVAFGQAVIAVDTHVFRVSNRLGLIKTDNVFDTEEKLYKVIPKKFVPHINSLFVLFGRYICKAQKPMCRNCPVRELCSHVATKS